MKTMTYKGFEGSAEVDTNRQVCRGKLLFIPDLVTFEAESPKALQAEFEAAVDDYLETCAALGRDPHKPLRGSFNVRVPSELHRAAVVRAAQDDISLNEVVVHALDCYLNGRSQVHNNVTIRVDAVHSVSALNSPVSNWQSLTTPNVH